MIYAPKELHLVSAKPDFRSIFIKYSMVVEV